MRTPLALALVMFVFTVDCAAQEIIVKPVELAPPTTYAGLEKVEGPVPSGPCSLPSVSLTVDSLRPIILGDSATLMLPSGWQNIDLRATDDAHVRTRLAGPGDSRVLVDRERNGATGRHFLMYGNGERPEGATCSLTRGQAGAIWTFYPPNPQDNGLRRYTALGSIITPAGLWYSVTLAAASADGQYQTGERP